MHLPASQIERLGATKQGRGRLLPRQALPHPGQRRPDGGQVHRREHARRAGLRVPPQRLRAVEGADTREAHPCQHVIPGRPHPALAAREPGQSAQDAPPLGAVGLAFDPAVRSLCKCPVADMLVAVVIGP